jgi:hypothetical protein
MYTYTAVQLQSKTFAQLKLIARELDIVPTADRRCRQNWIDAIAGVNPPLLQLLEVSPAAEAQQPIIETVENSPGVEVDLAQEPIEIQRQEAIAQAVEISPGVESDRHPILTGLTFSDRFLARYAPPQAQIIHFQSDADGQLSLLDFEVQSVDEPPDPDDFESLKLFREALALWDWEHNEVSPEYNEPLQVSLDSFSLWGFCPADWYESVVLLEPPDTGIFAKLPKSNPPSFPPATVGQLRAKRSPNVAQTQSKRISNAYQTHTCCIAAGSSTQPARSPPGGDACLV